MPRRGYGLILKSDLAGEIAALTAQAVESGRQPCTLCGGALTRELSLLSRKVALCV